MKALQQAEPVVFVLPEMTVVGLDVVAVDDDERKFFASAVSLTIPFQLALLRSSIVRRSVVASKMNLMLEEFGILNKCLKNPDKLVNYSLIDCSVTVNKLHLDLTLKLGCRALVFEISIFQAAVAGALVVAT